jgi:hypothetical protein
MKLKIENSIDKEIIISPRSTYKLKLNQKHQDFIYSIPLLKIDSFQKIFVDTKGLIKATEKEGISGVLVVNKHDGQTLLQKISLEYPYYLYLFYKEQKTSELVIINN